MQNPALLVIDVQKGLDDIAWGERNNPNAEANIAILLAMWREQESPVLHVQHCSTVPNSPLRPELPGNDIKEEAKPEANEPLFKKTVNSAFIGTELQSWLSDNDIVSLVVVGLTTDHCVSTSVRMGGNLGFDVTVVSDATATFERIGPDGKHYTAEDMHNINLASLHEEFCSVLTTEEVLLKIESFKHVN